MTIQKFLSFLTEATPEQQSQAAKDWAKEHFVSDEVPTWGGGFVVEHNYIQAIIDGIERDGLTTKVY
jgi:hypothetical protein